MNFIKKTIYLMLGLGGLISFQSCSDWNEVSPKTPDYTELKDANPEQYAKYLENLREYRELDHKVAYAWFDNSEKNASLKYQHINNMPDSVDVVILTSPDNLVERELKEIDEIREKGMKVIYTVDFDAIKSQYNDYLAQIESDREAAIEAGEEIEEAVIIERFDFIVEKLQNSFRLIDKYNYDGICLSYVGRSTIHMESEEYKQYTEDESVLLSMYNSWYKKHKDSYLVFAGNPQYLLDSSILSDFEHIVIYTQTANTAYRLQYIVELSLGENIPKDRYVVVAQLPSKDPNLSKVGTWIDKSNAVLSTAIWATGNFDYTIAGIGIMDIQNDYHSLPRIYSHSREAISILNPSLK